MNLNLLKEPAFSAAPGLLEANRMLGLQVASMVPQGAGVVGWDPKACTWQEYCEMKADEMFELEYDQASGVAMMAVTGMMCAGVDPVYEYLCDMYNTERIMENLKEAEQLPGLKLLVVYFDSGGGSVRAIKEAGRALAAFTKAPTLSWMAYCASAALHVAVGADYVAAPAWAGVGSIGTFFAIPDLAGWWKQMGIEWTILRDGKYKAMGHPGHSLTKEETALLQATLDKYSAEFKDWVKARRSGVSDEQMQGQMFTAEDVPQLVDQVGFDSLPALVEWLLPQLGR